MLECWRPDVQVQTSTLWHGHRRQSRCRDLFENGAAAFQAQERPYRQVEEKQKRIEFLEKKVQNKDEVLAHAAF
jgi:hypothetical protein